jgi:hypothetical protein
MRRPAGADQPQDTPAHQCGDPLSMMIGELTVTLLQWLGRVLPSPQRYTPTVPIISVFFGIVVRMFYKEHEPAHFHAEYQGQQGKFDLDGRLIVGNLQSSTALRLISD